MYVMLFGFLLIRYKDFPYYTLVQYPYSAITVSADASSLNPPDDSVLCGKKQNSSAPSSTILVLSEISTRIVAVVAVSLASNPVFFIYTYLITSTSGSITVSLPVVVHATLDIPTVGSVTVSVSVTDRLNEESSLTPVDPLLLSNVNGGFNDIAILLYLLRSVKQPVL